MNRLLQPCLPWDYPTPIAGTKGGESPIPPLCTNHALSPDYHSLDHFDQMMNDWSKQQECKAKCRPNCEEVTYDYTMYTSILNPDKLCDEGTETRKVRLGTGEDHHSNKFLCRWH